jgi:hypothetical protein
MRRLSLFLASQHLNSETNFNFTYPVRCLRVPQAVRVPHIEDHYYILYHMSACQYACNYLKITKLSLSVCLALSLSYSVNVKVWCGLACDKFPSFCYISAAEVFTLRSYAL